MKFLASLILIIFMNSTANAQQRFKQQQIDFDRVKSAYQLKWDDLQKNLQKEGFSADFDLMINAYKSERKLEIWLKNKNGKKYQLFRTYPFAGYSGNLGPKVTEGDLQIPEGFYYINVFNPLSSFHLSLGIDYPNKVDKIRTGKDRKTGGDIYIHGDNQTVGCIPLTDDKIREVYILAIEAKNNGQMNIPVNIYPFMMSKINLEKYGKEFPQYLSFWKTLQSGYSYFEQHGSLPKVNQVNGSYLIK